MAGKIKGSSILSFWRNCAPDLPGPWEGKEILARPFSGHKPDRTYSRFRRSRPKKRHPGIQEKFGLARPGHFPARPGAPQKTGLHYLSRALSHGKLRGMRNRMFRIALSLLHMRPLLRVRIVRKMGFSCRNADISIWQNEYGTGLWHHMETPGYSIGFLPVFWDNAVLGDIKHI